MQGSPHVFIYDSIGALGLQMKDYGRRKLQFWGWIWTQFSVHDGHLWSKMCNIGVMKCKESVFQVFVIHL